MSNWCLKNINCYKIDPRTLQLNNKIGSQI